MGEEGKSYFNQGWKEERQCLTQLGRLADCWGLREDLGGEDRWGGGGRIELGISKVEFIWEIAPGAWKLQSAV